MEAQEKFIKLLNTGIIAVEVPRDATEVQVWNHGVGFKAKSIKREPDDTNGFFHLHIGLCCWRDFELIGEATEDEISFDVEPYVEKKHFTSLFDGKPNFHYYNYVYPHYLCLDEKESFRSLLQASGLNWANPFSNKCEKETPPSQDFEHLKQWQEAERKLIKGKLIFLKPIK